MCDEKVKLRRYEDDLHVGGIGVVILGAWDVLKVVIHGIMNLKADISLEAVAGEDKVIGAVIVAVIIAVILFLFFLVFKIHLYIGLNASKAARGEPYKKGYYKGAVILLVLSVISIFG